MPKKRYLRVLNH